MNFPLHTAPVGNYPMRCIYSDVAVEPGQLVALSPLGLVALVVLTHTTEGEPLPANVEAYGSAVLRAYVQRRGWLQPGQERLESMTNSVFKRLRATIPPGESRYIHQLLLQIDVVPWLTTMHQTPDAEKPGGVAPPTDSAFVNEPER